MKKTILILAVLIAGCASLPKPSAQLAIYDFGTSKTNAPKALNLRFSGISSAPGLASPEIRYRLNYKDAARVYAYNESRWLAPPAELIAQRLRQTMVFGSSACKLRLELLGFDQVFDTPTQSRGVVRILAVVARTGQKPPLQQEFILENPASSPDAHGGVAALTVATDDALGRLTTWAQGIDCGAT